MSQYSASNLDVTANYMGEHIPCTITNVAWNGNQFSGQIYGIGINGTDNNGQISASGIVCGTHYSATGLVTGWS